MSEVKKMRIIELSNDKDEVKFKIFSDGL